ncbi:hypothetical protein SNE40_006791 [Patella caerulea]|uniref:MATH domain-containing protein n=1 Tax=Patella caerulea TaxID=87958 RepID=A0AAN8JUZ2_PATCE
MNEIQLTNQLGQIKPRMKKHDKETATGHDLLNSGAASDNNLSNVDAVINKTCIFQFNLHREKKIHFIGNSDVKHGGLSWWRYASIHDNKLSLRLELTVLDSFTGPLPNKILIKLELLNKRNHELNKMKQSTIQLKETYYWKDIINMDELENPSLGFVDDQGVFTFRLVVLHVTTKK